MDTSLNSIRNRASIILNSYKGDLSSGNPQDELKKHTTRILLITILFASAVSFVFLLYTRAVIYSYLVQLLVVIICIFLLWRIEKGCPTERIALSTLIWYGFIMTPLVWTQLTISHPMISILLCFSCVMTVLLFDGKTQKIIIGATILMVVGMFIYDGYTEFEKGTEFFQSFIGRGIGLLITAVMVIYCVMMFKKKFNQLSHTLYKNSMVDPLTGAYNARMLDYLLDEYKKIFSEEDENFGLALIDMDNFKSVNDTFGHDVGDILLKGFTDAIRSHLREGDILARYGGDEFIILLPGCDRNKAVEVVDRLMKEVNSMAISSADYQVTFSAGVTDMKESSRTNTDIFKLADLKMYKAKDLGRNRVYSAVLLDT